MTFAWNDEAVDLLKKLRADGLSARQIAQQMGGGLTRNAAMGKLSRLGLLNRAQPSAPKRAKAVEKPAHAPSPPRPIVEPLPADAPGLATSLTLEAHVCRWPIGDPRRADFAFCGRPAVGSYCPAHNQIAHQPAKPRNNVDDLARFMRRYS